MDPNCGRSWLQLVKQYAVEEVNTELCSSDARKCLARNKETGADSDRQRRRQYWCIGNSLVSSFSFRMFSSDVKGNLGEARGLPCRGQPQADTGLDPAALLASLLPLFPFSYPAPAPAAG